MSVSFTKKTSFELQMFFSKVMFLLYVFIPFFYLFAPGRNERRTIFYILNHIFYFKKIFFILILNKCNLFFR